MKLLNKVSIKDQAVIAEDIRKIFQNWEKL